jgi:hypothetical protein
MPPNRILPYFVFTLMTYAFKLQEFIETLEMHYYSFPIILDPIVLEIR